MAPSALARPSRGFLACGLAVLLAPVAARERACEASEEEFFAALQAQVTPHAPSSTTCEDVPGWVSTFGNGCDSYEAWCNPDGTYGPAWEAYWGTWEVYATGGYTGPQACCGCGRATVCQNDPVLWQDKRGYYCTDYAKFGWCTASGDYGTGWDKSWGTFHDYAVEGKSALNACCACGGPTKMPGKPAPPACRDLESRWLDKRWSGLPGDIPGETCVSHTERGWCTPSGGYGPGWDVNAQGTFADWANPLPADQVCCGCGGGMKCKPVCEYCDGVCAAIGGATDSCKRHCTTHFGKLQVVMGRFCHGGLCSDSSSQKQLEGSACGTKERYCSDLCSAFSGCTLGVSSSECVSACSANFGDLDSLWQGYCKAGVCHEKGDEADADA